MFRKLGVTSVATAKGKSRLRHLTIIGLTHRQPISFDSLIYVEPVGDIVDDSQNYFARFSLKRGTL